MKKVALVIGAIAVAIAVYYGTRDRTAESAADN
jgi:hypothetical protein